MLVDICVGYGCYDYGYYYPRISSRTQLILSLLSASLILIMLIVAALVCTIDGRKNSIYGSESASENVGKFNDNNLGSPSTNIKYSEAQQCSAQTRLC